MKRDALNSYIGQQVELTMFDNDIVVGVLNFCDRFCEEHQYRKPNFYYIDHFCFRASHVKKLKLLSSEVL